MTNILNDIVVLLACSTLIFTLHGLIAPSISSTKGKTWIVSLTSSLVLSLYGSHSVLYVLSRDLWTGEYVYGIEDYTSRLVLIFFFSANMMDMIITIMYYPKFINALTLVAHHIFYMGFSSILLYFQYSRGFALCFFMEIPTAILALGSVWKHLRSDFLFGATFFLCRLVYNVYLIMKLYQIAPGGAIWRVCTGVLCLHIFWFYKWLISYTKKKA